MVTMKSDADLVEAPQAPRVKPLVWRKSHMPSWNDDWHTVPTGYSIRCADEWGWKWSSTLGAHGHERSSEAAKAAAQADHEARVLAALDLTPDMAAIVGCLRDGLECAAAIMDTPIARRRLGLEADDERLLVFRAALAAMKGGKVNG